MSQDAILQEGGGKILLEDGTGVLVQESSTPTPEPPPALGRGGTIEFRYRQNPRVWNL